jgi:hypothetical protein
VLHVSPSWAGDLVPARAAGMRTALIGRAEGASPDLELPSLTALADALGV